MWLDPSKWYSSHMETLSYYIGLHVLSIKRNIFGPKADYFYKRESNCFCYLICSPLVCVLFPLQYKQMHQLSYFSKPNIVFRPPVQEDHEPQNGRKVFPRKYRCGLVLFFCFSLCFHHWPASGTRHWAG